VYILAKRLAGKSIPEMTQFVSTGTLNPKSVDQSIHTARYELHHHVWRCELNRRQPAGVSLKHIRNNHPVFTPPDADSTVVIDGRFWTTKVGVPETEMVQINSHRSYCANCCRHCGLSMTGPILRGHSGPLCHASVPTLDATRPSRRAV